MCHSNLQNQRLFAFCLLIKSRKLNSTVYSGDHKKIYCDSLGMSVNTFRKYFNRAIEQGLAVKSGKQYVIIDWRKCLQITGLQDKGARLNKLFKLKDISLMNIRQITNWVRECFILQNFTQQQHQINKKSNLLSACKNIVSGNNRDKVDYKLYVSIIKKAKKECKTLEQYCACVIKKTSQNIVTGCVYLGKKLSNCTSTANNALKSLVKSELIERELIKEVINRPFNHYSFDSIVQEYGRNSFFIKGNKFIRPIGSKINLLIPISNCKK